MEQQTGKMENSLLAKSELQANSLRSRADDLLIAIAVLGLVATIVDCEANVREIDSFTREFRKRFALSRRQSLKLIGLALKRIRMANGANMIDCACDTLNEHLDSLQKMELFEALSDVLIADGRIQEGEECFLDYIAGKLNILQSLMKRYPIV